jgi:UTP--glucose-1-phosphate uridylyltransferase
MLPVVDKPLIQYAVEEAARAGITDMIFITGRSKRAIEDHFDKAYELEAELAAKNKTALLEVVRSVAPPSINCIYIRQPEALGLGHAVLCARPVVGDEPFAVLLADDLMDVGPDGPSVMQQMVEVFDRTGASVIAVEDVPREDTSRYGIVTCDPPQDGAAGAATSGASAGRPVAVIRGIVEKPAPQVAPSTLAVVGRYLLTPRIFDLIAAQPPGAGGEIQLTDAIARLIHEQTVLAYRFAGRRFDCGSKLGYMQASVTLGVRHSEIGPDFRQWLQSADR